MGFSLGAIFIGLGEAEAAAAPLEIAAADAGAIAAADAGAVAAADIGAGAALGGEVGAFGAGAADLTGAGLGITGEAATGAGGLAAGDAFAPLAADFSALGSEGAVGATGADLGSLSAVNAIPELPGSSIATSAAPTSAIPQTGSIVSPSAALDAGSQDILSQAGGNLFDTGGAAPAASSAPAPSGDSLTFSPTSPTTTTPAAAGAPSDWAGAAGSAPTTEAPPPAAAPPAAAPASTATAAAPTAGAGGGSSAFGGNGWGWKAAGLALAAAPLALTLARGEQPLPAQAGAVSGISAQQAAASQPFLQSVQNNQPTASQMAQLAQQEANLTNQWRQVLFNQGVQNPQADSRWPQIQAQIAQQMQVQTQAMIQSNLQAALGFSGAASSNLLQLANLQVQQDAAFTNAISGATRALGSISALTATGQKLAA